MLLTTVVCMMCLCMCPYSIGFPCLDNCFLCWSSWKKCLQMVRHDSLSVHCNKRLRFGYGVFFNPWCSDIHRVSKDLEGNQMFLLLSFNALQCVRFLLSILIVGFSFLVGQEIKSRILVSPKWSNFTSAHVSFPWFWT